MHIQVNTDNHIAGREQLAEQSRAVVEDALSRFKDQVTRVEVHIGDENSHKGGSNDKRCMMEARLEGLRPFAVTHQAATIDQALQGAADKLKRMLESNLGRLRGY
jgi:hypothetical protein